MLSATSDVRDVRPALKVVVAVAVICGVILRIWSESPLWLDEALSVNIASLGPGEIGEALRRDGHPPLYYLLLWAWTTAFGETEFAVRSLSGVIGLISLSALYLTARLVLGTRVALIAVAILATSPFAIRYSTEARMYALVMLLVIIGDRALRSALAGARRGLVGVAVITAMLALTHYWAFFLLAAVGILVLAHAALSAAEARANAVRTATAMIIGGLAFAPWVPTLLFQLEHTGTPWARPPALTEIVRVTLVDIGGHPDLVGQALKFLIIGIVGIAVATVVRTGWRTDPLTPYLAVLALTATIGIGIMTATGTAFATRYVAMLIPLLVVVLAVGISRLPSHASVGVLLGVVVLGVAGSVTTATTDRTQSASVAAAINDVAVQGDLVVFCPDQLGPAFGRELPSSLTKLAYPTLGDPALIDWVDYEDRNSAADPVAIARALDERAGDRSIFLVWNNTYRTFEGQCDALADTLGALGRERILLQDKTDVFEPAWATHFPAA